MAIGERAGALGAIAAVLVACGLLLMTGCGAPPQVAGEDRALIVSLATAVSARDPRWLDANDRLIERRHADGGLSDAAHRALSAVVAEARAGRWTEAEHAITALREGQDPDDNDARAASERHVHHAGRMPPVGRGRRPPG
jgi:hypothetical protein